MCILSSDICVLLTLLSFFRKSFFHGTTMELMPISIFVLIPAMSRFPLRSLFDLSPFLFNLFLCLLLGSAGGNTTLKYIRTKILAFPYEDDRERDRRARGDLRPGAAEDLQGRLQTCAVPRPGAGVQGRPQGGLLLRRQGDQAGRETHRDKGDEKDNFVQTKLPNY